MTDSAPHPTFIGQLIVGNFNTPLYRLTIYPDHLVLKYRTEKVITREEVDAVRPFKFPIIGLFFNSGVRIQHHCPAFDPRVVFKTFHSKSVLDAMQRLGYPVDR